MFILQKCVSRELESFKTFEVVEILKFLKVCSHHDGVVLEIVRQ